MSDDYMIESFTCIFINLDLEMVELQKDANTGIEYYEDLDTKLEEYWESKR